MSSAPPDPHASAPEVTSQRGPDATHAPESEAQLRVEEEEAEAHNCTLLLPKVFLVRHGQSLFNAHYKAHAELPPKGQTRLNFTSASSSSGGSGASSPASAPLEDGSLVGGLPLRRDRKPMTDPRLLDAPLTPFGQEQARAAAIEARRLGQLDLVLSTPLTRALQTALLVFRPHHNAVDWSCAHHPSLDQPVPNISLAAPPQPSQPQQSQPDPPKHVPIRVVPFHVENLCASCDVGVPLSVLESRFAGEPDVDFQTARKLMSDCWWAGASVGLNIAHLVIKRAAPGAPHPDPPAAVSASAGEAAAAAASSATAAAAAAAPRTSITLKRSDSLSVSGLHISREQSHQIESRTRSLLLYLLNLAVEHSVNPDKSHRAMHVALVGHCGFFARLSGHTLDNCAMVELDWLTVLKRSSVKGLLSLPVGIKHSDIIDVTKHRRLIEHWRAELMGGTTRASPSSGAPFTASNPPLSSNTAHLHPPAGAVSNQSAQ